MVILEKEEDQPIVIGAAVFVGAWIWPSGIWVMGSMDMVIVDCESAGALRLRARVKKVKKVVAIVSAMQLRAGRGVTLNESL